MFALICGTLAAVPATTPGATPDSPLMENPAGILAVLLAVLAIIFWLMQQPATKPIFKVIPALVLCYFIPTTLTTLGVLPDESVLYEWVKTYMLPASLLLLVLSLDLPGILRLGWKPGVLLLTGTFSVVIGGPIALYLGQLFLKGDTWGLPPEAWKGFAALSGSWIGGGANFIAIGDSVGATGAMIAMMVVPDVLVASVWMGVLLYLSGYQRRIDAWTGADASAIRELERRLTDFQAQVTRVPRLADLMIILALGFVASWISFKGADEIGTRSFAYAKMVAAEVGLTEIDVDPDPARPPVPLEHKDVKPPKVGPAIDKVVAQRPEALDWMTNGQRIWYRLARFVNEITGGSMWKYVFVTTLGLILSFTRVRNLEGAGASKVGSVMLYLLVACIGASADFKRMAEAPGYIVVGFMWMAVHVVILLSVGRLIRAPIFFVAVASQANIGGAASAPIVASAYHPSLAPVGVLLAVAGYVLGTYAGLLCATMLRWVAGAG